MTNNSYLNIIKFLKEEVYDENLAQIDSYVSQQAVIFYQILEDEYKRAEGRENPLESAASMAIHAISTFPAYLEPDIVMDELVDAIQEIIPLAIAAYKADKSEIE